MPTIKPRSIPPISRIASPLLTVLVVVSLLLTQVAPVLAQGGTVFLPLIGRNGVASAGAESELLRTRLAVTTPNQWRDLADLQLKLLNVGVDFAVVLVDGEQLETLARWHFLPTQTDELSQLVAANTTVNSLVAASLQPLLVQATATHQAVVAQELAAATVDRKSVV